MASVNIYLPPELYRRVKDQQVPVSQVCQRALRIELDRLERRRQHATLEADRLTSTNRRQQ